jgi:DNA-binding response OmpR family regulator
MSGIESTREIRALEKQFPEEFKRSFIIALTGLAAGTDRHEAFDAGVDAFMVKPVSFKDLEKMLQQHVRQGRRNSSVRTTAKEKDMWKGNGSGIISVESERGKMIEIKTRLGASAAKPLLEKEGEEGR